MSDVIDRPILAEEVAAKSRLRIIDCDVHPSIHAHTDLEQFMPKRWQEHLRTYGSHLRTPYIGTTPYPRSSPLIARRDAWPPTGGPPGSDLAFHAEAISRSARRRVRHSAGARPLHLLAAESRIRRRDPARHQRLAARVLVRSRSAAEGLDPRRPGRYATRDRRDRALRQDRPLCADQCLPARQRAARTPPLLADLRARAGTRPAARHSRRRLWRSRADRRRLAVLLCRGAPEQRAHHGGAAHQPRARRHPGALSETEDRVHRGRLRLDPVGHLADGPALRGVPQRGAASQAPAVGICEGAFLVHDAADRRAG